MALPADIILRYFKKTKNTKSEDTLYKKGKTISRFGTSQNLFKSRRFISQKEVAMDEYKIEDANVFSAHKISQFIENGDTNEIKNDKNYDIFRHLMNEKQFEFDQSPFGAFQKPEVQNTDANKFTWFKDPNFKMDNDSSEEEKKEQEPVNTEEDFRDSLMIQTDEGIISSGSKRKSMRIELLQINDKKDLNKVNLASRSFTNKNSKKRLTGNENKSKI